MNDGSSLGTHHTPVSGGYNQSGKGSYNPTQGFNAGSDDDLENH